MSIYEISFKNDKSLFNKTTILIYLNENDLELRYVNTKNNKVYKSWKKMAIEEYKNRGFIYNEYELYSNVVWEEKNGNK